MSEEVSDSEEVSESEEVWQHVSEKVSEEVSEYSRHVTRWQNRCFRHVLTWQDSSSWFIRPAESSRVGIVICTLPNIYSFPIQHIMAGATISHSVADDTVPASERAFYSFTGSSVVKSRHTELHDYRSSSDVLHGPEGLDAQGFTYVERDFSLNSMELLEGHNIEDIYFREVEDLVLKATGAKRVLGLEAVVRCQKTIAKEELKSRQAKGGERNSAFDGQDREAPLGS